VGKVPPARLRQTTPGDGGPGGGARKRGGLGRLDPRNPPVTYSLATESLDNTRLRIQSQCFTATWDTAKFNRLAVEIHPPASDFGITKDRKRVVRSQMSGTGKDGIQPALLLWDVATGKAAREFPLDGRVYDTVAAVSDDQRFLAVTRNSGSEIAVWDWPANKEVGVIDFVPDGEYDFIRTMGFSPDGKALYAGCSRGNLLVYDLMTKTKTRSWKPCVTNVMRIHFSPDEKT